MSLGQRTFIVYLLILVFGVGLSGFIYTRGANISKQTASLVDNQLPRIALIGDLRTAVVEHERLLYEYYATEGEALPADINSTYGRLAETTATLQRAFPLLVPELNTANIQFIQVQSLSQKLGEVLQHKPVNWNLARDILIEITSRNRKIVPLLDSLIEKIHADGKQVADNINSDIQFTNIFVVGISLLILVIAGFVGWYVNLYIQEDAVRLRLSMFPERNPRPVLSFDWHGKLTYANPAARLMVENMPDNIRAVEDLLSGGYLQQFSALKKTRDYYHQWQAKIGNYYFDYVVSILRDQRVFQLHINDITSQHELEQRLRFQAFHDATTEFPNRRQFELDLEMALAKFPVPKTAVIFSSIDRFDLVTLSSSHHVGDQLAKAVVTQLNEIANLFRSESQCINVYHFGSADFGVLISGIKNNKDVWYAWKQLKASLDRPITIESKEFYVRLSAGVSVTPSHGVSKSVLIKNTDTALAKAKGQSGNNMLMYSEGMSVHEQHWLKIESDLRHAINLKQLEVYYQPKVTSNNRTLLGAEALLRWRNSHGEYIAPEEFIPVAEQSGLMIPIGDWVIRSACMQASLWCNSSARAENNPSIAINLSAKQFQHYKFIETVEAIFKETNVNPENIEFEITESSIMQDIDHSIELMDKLKNMGCTLSIDDFGTGYSSLSYLKQFPVDKLKIDRSFVRNVIDNDNDQAIVKTIIGLAHNLHLSVVAEGVETEAQFELLSEWGCEEIQGFVISKAIPANEFTKKFL